MSYLPNFNTWYAKKKKREDADQTTRSVAVAAPEAVQTVNMPEGKSNDKSAVELPNFTEWLNQRERSGTARYGEATSSTKSIGQFQRLAAETNALAAALEKSYRDTGYQNPLQAYDQLRTDTNKISSLRKRVQAAQDAETNTELAKRYDQMDEALRLLIDGVSEGNNRFAAYSSAQELAKEIVDNGRAAGEARARAEETERLLGMSDEDIAKRKAEAQAVIDAFNAGNIDNILQYGENTPENRQKAAEQEQAVRDATKTLAEIERDEKARNAILNANEEAELYARLSAGGEAAFDEAIQAAPNRGERNRLKEMRFRYQQEQTAKGYKALLEEPDFEQYSEMWRQEEAPERWNAFDEKRLLYEVNDMLPAQAEKNVGAVLLGAVDRGAQYEGLTDTERQIFNYLWYKQGSDDAEKYLQSLNRELNARRAQATMEYTAKQAADSPVTGTLANVSSVFAQPLAAAATAMQQVKNAWGEGVGYYEPLDQNADWFSGVHMDQATREGLKEGKSDAAGFFIDTGLSMLQFGVRLPMGEVASLASMGLSSMGSTAYDVMERGGTTEQAFWSGAAAGVAEVAFEKMGIDRLFAAKGAGKGELVQTILQGMAEEGLEEMGTEVANIVADAIIMGDKSQFQTAIQNYMADGLDEQAARARAIGDLMGQVALSGAGGALMGTVMDPISYGVQAANRGMQTRNAGKALLDSGELGNYLDSVQAAGGDGEAFRQAQALQGKLEAGKKVSAYEAGRLQRANEVALREETMRTLRGRLAGQGLDYAQYHDITSGLEKALQGERMSDGEAAAIAGNPIALEALSELADANVAANAGAVLDTAPAAAFATFGENDPLAARRAEPAAAGRDAGVAETAQPAAGADPDAVQRALLAAAYEANGNAREAFGMAERGAAAPIAREELESNALEGRNGSLRDAAPMLDGETAETRETVPAAHEGLTGAEMEAEAPAAAALAQQRAAQLQEAAAPYGPEAGAFVKGYDGSRSVAEYARAYRRFYDNGRAGVPYDYTLQHSALAGWLSADARQYAYAAGQRAAQADLARQERARSQDAQQAGPEPGVVQDYDPDMQLSKDQEGQIVALDAVARFTGRRIRVVETIADDAGQSYANAQFDREAGEIVVALDALDDGMLYAVGHELIHDVRSKDEAGYRKLRDFVVAELVRTEDYDLEGEIDRIQELYRRQAHQELDRDGALEEIVAQSYAQVLSDRAALERMAQQDRGLLETIVEFFKGLLEKLDELAGKLAGQDRAAASLRRSEDTLRRMRDLAFAVLEENRGTVLYDSARERAVSFNLKEYSELQRQNWAESKSIVIYESPEQARRFVEDAIAHRNLGKKLYFGMVPDELSQRVSLETGVDIAGYNCTLHAQEILKILNRHGNGAAEEAHGQRAITADDFVLIPEIVQNPDQIRLSEKLYNGRPVLLFSKTINGRTTVVTYASQRRRDLTVQTMYAGKTKGSLATTTDAKTPVITSETTRGTASVANVSQTQSDVNTSIRGKGGNDAGEVKFSVKNPYAGRAMAEDEGLYTYDFLTALPDMETVALPEVDTVRNRNGRIDARLAVDEGMKNARDVGTERDGKVFVSNAYTGENLRITNKSIRHGLNGNMNRLLTNARLGAVIGDVVKNAVPINALHNKAEGVTGTYAMAAYAADSQGREFVTIVTVEEKTGEVTGIETYATIHAVSGRQRKSSQADTKSQSINSIKAANISIADLLGIVKDTYQSILSEDVLAQLGETRNPEGEYTGKAKFSLKQTSLLDEDVAELERQNSALREANELLKAQFKLTKGRQVARQGVETVAGKLLREYHSGYDKATLADNIVQLAAFLDNAGDPDSEGWESAWRQANDLAATVARGVLEESGRMNTELYDAYRGFREELRNTGIKVSEEARREAAYQFGSWEQFRRANFGRIRFTNDGTPLDSLWGELAEKYPGLLNPEANELEQPIRLVEALQAIAPVWENPYGMSTDAAAAELASRLFEEYYKLPDVRTFADKQKTIREQKLGKLRERYEQKMQEQRLAYRSEYERRLRAELQEAKRKLGERLSQREANRLARQKALYEKRIVKGKEKRAESAAMNKYKKRIKTNTATLYQWLLRPTDAKHVPESLRVTVGRFLQTISFVNEKNQNTKVAEQWRERLRDLKDLLADAEKGEGPGVALLDGLDPDLVPRLQAFIGGTEEVRVVADLKVEQLRELDYLLGIVKRAVTDANKLLSNARYAQVAEVGDAAVAEMRRMRPVQPHSGPVSLLDRSLNLDMLDAFSYFDRLGPAATTILGELRQGFDAKIWDVDAAQQYMKNLLGDTKVREWGGKNARAHTFQVSGGEIALTPGQVMELYLLNKREQARGHIYHAEGGIRPAGDVRTEQGKRERLGDPVRVTEADVQGIIDTLTDEQRRIADGMQQYLGNDVANWGNDVSLRLYGYKKFTEKHYWPIKVDANSVRTTDKSEAGSGDNGSLYALRNLGATKSAQEGAHNALVLRDAFETFAGHVNDMSSYHGLVPALADAMKWFNYPGVKASIDRVAGPGGQAYFKQLIRDINGAARTDTAGVADLLLGHAKVAAVGANARVVLQQPTAYLRAAALISPKYLAEGVFTKEGARKAKQYSAIALWKSWGYYDMNIGRSMREVIVGDGGITQKIREKSLAPAGWADDITWGALWNACEAETKDLRKDLKPGTEAFYRAVADRFAEIVDRTQVVDSVFHRSQLMRSKNGLAKITTPFMAEPIKSYNMLRSAASACRRNPSKANQRRVWRVGFTFVATSVATAAAASIADAFRDDDEERSWLEKWLYAMLGIDMDWDEETTLGERVGSIASSNVLDNLNPLNMIPVVKDIVSMLYGYDPSRLDMQGISRLVQAGKTVVDYFTGDSKYTFYQVIYQAAQAVSSLSGIPVGNLMRTFNSLAEAINPDFIDFTKPSARSSTEIYDKLYEGMISGQQKDAARWRAAAEEKARKSIADSDTEYDDEALEAENRIAKGLAAALRRREPRIAEMGDLQMDGLYGSNEREYAKLQAELEAQGFSPEMITGAVKRYIGDLGGDTNEVNPYDPALHMEDYDLFMAHENEPRAYEEMRKALADAGKSDNDIANMLLSGQNKWAKQNGELEISYDNLYDTVLEEGIAGSTAKDIIKGLEAYGKDAAGIRQSLNGKLKKDYLEAAARGDQQATKELSRLLTMVGNPYIGGKSNAEVLEWLRPKTKK